MRNFTILLAILGTLISGIMLFREIKNPTPKKEVISLDPSITPSSVLGSASLYTPVLPEQIIKDFYAWYLGCGSGLTAEDRGICNWQENEHVSVKLIKNLSKQKDMGYDPIVCGKDMPKEVFISKSDIDNADATITVIFKSAINRIADIKLAIEENEDDKKKGERYKITNIVCSL